MRAMLGAPFPRCNRWTDMQARAIAPVLCFLAARGGRHPGLRRASSIRLRLTFGGSVPGNNAEGTARRSARLPFKCAPCFHKVRRLSARHHGVFPCCAGPRFLRTARFCPDPEGRTSAPGRGLRTPDRTLSGPPSASSSQGPLVTRAVPRRSPSAGLRSPARGRRAAVTFRSGPECAGGCSPPPSASRLLHHRDVSRRRPQPSKARWNMVLDCGRCMEYIPRKENGTDRGRRGGWWG